MFISPAYAQAAGGGGGSDFIIQLLPLVLIFVVFYFLIIRPQQKKVKDHKAMVEALKRGDRVVTTGGLIGTIQRVVSDREAVLEIADGVRVRIIRSMIAEITAKTEPVAADDKPEKAEKKAPSGPTYWEILGVPEGAGQAEVDTAAEKKAGDAAAAEAIETLKDPVKRKLYARLGHDEYVSAVKG
ncbi:MAG: preprotein translocase subunit YajC [Alphaproteobacteria bacterium]|nr:preprotein translocase subunit YajC [Alphaproteobacteria bacterium]